MGIRQAPLQAASYDEASSELEALDDADLRELLESSEPKSL